MPSTTRSPDHWTGMIIAPRIYDWLNLNGACMIFFLMRWVSSPLKFIPVDEGIPGAVKACLRTGAVIFHLNGQFLHQNDME